MGMEIELYVARHADIGEEIKSKYCRYSVEGINYSTIVTYSRKHSTGSSFYASSLSDLRLRSSNYHRSVSHPVESSRRAERVSESEQRIDTLLVTPTTSTRTAMEDPQRVCSAQAASVSVSVSECLSYSV